MVFVTNYTPTEVSPPSKSASFKVVDYLASAGLVLCWAKGQNGLFADNGFSLIM